MATVNISQGLYDALKEKCNEYCDEDDDSHHPEIDDILEIYLVWALESFDDYHDIIYDYDEWIAD